MCGFVPSILFYINEGILNISFSQVYLTNWQQRACHMCESTGNLIILCDSVSSSVLRQFLRICAINLTAERKEKESAGCVCVYVLVGDSGASQCVVSCILLFQKEAAAPML